MSTRAANDPVDVDQQPTLDLAMPLAKVRGEPFTEMPSDLYIPPEALSVFLETFEGRRLAAELANTGALQAVPRLQLDAPSAITRRYLSTVYPTPAILVVESELDLELDVPIAVEVAVGDLSLIHI